MQDECVPRVLPTTAAYYRRPFLQETLPTSAANSLYMEQLFFTSRFFLAIQSPMPKPKKILAANHFNNDAFNNSV